MGGHFGPVSCAHVPYVQLTCLCVFCVCVCVSCWWSCADRRTAAPIRFAAYSIRLQAAQAALSDYFTRLAPARRSQGAIGSGAGGATGRASAAERRERRKSMPSFSPELAATLRDRAPPAAASQQQPQPRRPSGAADNDLDWRRPQRRLSHERRQIDPMAPATVAMTANDYR